MRAAGAPTGRHPQQQQDAQAGGAFGGGGFDGGVAFSGGGGAFSQVNELTRENAALFSELERFKSENVSLRQQSSDVPAGTSDIAAAKIKVTFDERSATPCNYVLFENLTLTSNL